MRRIVAYGPYYQTFMASLRADDQMKIRRAILLFQTSDRVPWHYVKYVEEGIFEFRVSVTGKEARLFFIHDEGDTVVFFNCFFKKRKTLPHKEIAMAKKLKKQYEQSKQNL